MKFSILAATALASISSVSADIYLQEQFNDEGWKDRWTVSSEWKSAAELGEWKHTAGLYHADPEDKGIQTGNDARHYGLSAKLDKPFNSSDGKDIVIQYSVKHEQDIDCGGAYIKLLPGGDKFDAKKFGGDTPYGIMFGPDICGANKRTHVILHSEDKGEGLLINKDVPCEKDTFSHLYTLVVRPDNTFEVYVDGKSVRSGKLEDEFSFLEAKEIMDPNVSKPADWVDTKMIPDPTDVKPEGYDDVVAEIPDADVTKPEDWDDEDDGEWEPPMVDNPDYKGPWTPKMIDNPEYKGAWVHPIIPNPNYKYNDKMYAVCPDGCTHIGFELWQVKAGTIFDDIIITDSYSEAQNFAEETFFKKKSGERNAHSRAETERASSPNADEDDAEFDNLIADDDDDDDMDDDDLEDDDDGYGDEL
jgi:calreticulin